MVYRFTLRLQDRFDILWCVIYPRLFDYTKNKAGSKNGFNDNCPFCEQIKENDIVEWFKNFYVIKNRYPYAKTEDHLLIITKRHIRSWSDLSTEELVELKDIVSKYLDKWYLLLWRQYVWSWCKNHASVWHLHIHLILNEK